LAKTLQSWLLILDRNSRHYVKDHLIWGLLWGGILPLLYDAACLTLSRRGPVDNAVSSVALAPTVLSHCVELGRLGLSALLSVLREESGYTNLCALTNDIGYLGTMGALSDLDRNDSSSDGRAQENERQWYLAVSVHTAALTALSNLIVAAHVMMHRHAGKVVCELVAYHCKLLNLQGPNLDTNGANSETTGYNETTATANLDSKSALYRHDISALQQLALHTASVAVVVCGDSAQSILDRIAAVDDKNGHECNGTNESDNYDDHVLHTVTLIRHQAKAICSLRTAN
jgi:hypothetical protein